MMAAYLYTRVLYLSIGYSIYRVTTGRGNFYIYCVHSSCFSLTVKLYVIYYSSCCYIIRNNKNNILAIEVFFYIRFIMSLNYRIYKGCTARSSVAVCAAPATPLAQAKAGLTSRSSQQRPALRNYTNILPLSAANL